MTGGERVPGDDPWEGVVFDEAFIKGGRHEPPARTRESIARYGGERTSWRQGAPVEPVRTKRPRRRPGWGVQIFFAVAGVISIGVLVARGMVSAPEIPASAPPPAAPAIDSAESAPTDDALSPQPASTSQVSGMTEFDAVGTCYLDPLTGGGDVQLRTVDCTAQHNLELVSHRTAAIEGDSYPDDRYWHDVVGAACMDDMKAILGATLRADISAYWVYPRPDSWAFGDRHVFCMIQTDTLVTAPAVG